MIDTMLLTMIFKNSVKPQRWKNDQTLVSVISSSQKFLNTFFIQNLAFVDQMATETQKLFFSFIFVQNLIS